MSGERPDEAVVMHAKFSFGERQFTHLNGGSIDGAKSGQKRNELVETDDSFFHLHFRYDDGERFRED